MESDQEIKMILKESKNIAVVSISDKPDRDSYRVADYLMRNGYEIFAVNPNIREWNGKRAFPSLHDIPAGTEIDVVDVFRKSNSVVPIAHEAVAIKAKTLWLQEGVVNREAERIAKEHGLRAIMDRCMMKEHMKL